MLNSEVLREQIRVAVREELESIRTYDTVREQTPETITQVYIAKTPGGGIPALSGNTPGSATVDIYYIDGDGSAQQLDDGGAPSPNKVQETAYNFSQTAVAGNTWIHLKQEMVSGKLLCDFEDCG